MLEYQADLGEIIMDVVRNDITYTLDVLNGYNNEKYSNIYFKSNENLSNLFDTFDFRDKNCLAILSSGDQVFNLLNRGVKNIDLIDKNKLTIYYFYLRLWIVKYLNMYYPPVNFDCTFIRDLLKNVEFSNDKEKRAYDYWNLFISEFSDRNISHLFLTVNDLFDNSISNLTDLRKKIDRKYDFYNSNIKDRLFISNKYDFIYLSNLLEWIIRDKDEMIPIRNNLYNLLNDNGYVICSNLCRCGNGGIGALIFEELFSCYDIPNTDGEEKSPGYVYIKRTIH